MSVPEPQHFGYPLNTIYFYLTEGCNLRCRHCWIVPEKESPRQATAFLDLGLFESILKQAQSLGLTGVKLTGGEPLLHPQIHRMLEILQGTDYRMVMETNGVLLTPEIAAAVAACHNPFVSVSLDGADIETHEWVRGVPGCFQAAQDGIRHLVEAGLKPQVIFTIMRRNRDQVEAIVRLAEKLGAGSVKFTHVQPSPRGDQMREKDETLTLPELMELGRWVEGELALAVDLTLIFGQPAAFRPLNRMFGQKGFGLEICGIKGVLGVLADGSYALCGIGQNLPEMVFGHAARDSLAEVWRDHPVLREIREGLPERLGGICRDCLVRGSCHGYCLALNYYLTRNLWTPFWFCDQAEAAGLFPIARKRPAAAGTISQRSK